MAVIVSCALTSGLPSKAHSGSRAAMAECPRAVMPWGSEATIPCGPKTHGPKCALTYETLKPSAMRGLRAPIFQFTQTVEL
eukprot:1484761-Pyramimonas_sp.AAC.1